MSGKNWSIALLVIGLAGCQTMGQLTVRDYKAKSGQRVMAGQAEPKSEYGCQKVAQGKQDWGLTGNMDKVAAMERVTSVAVDTAPGKGANYAYVMAPASFGIGTLNLNAFSDAEVAYYRCASLPAAK
ncbi:MAG TPA: hypothetical protein VN929_13890 [Burkholderiales bacterium]|nr:hypothetical protein [Burkholderiales bacterium]